jgi:hypothetical protein
MKEKHVEKIIDLFMKELELKRLELTSKNDYLFSARADLVKAKMDLGGDLDIIRHTIESGLSAKKKVETIAEILIETASISELNDKLTK